VTLIQILSFFCVGFVFVVKICSELGASDTIFFAELINLLKIFFLEGLKFFCVLFLEVLSLFSVGFVFVF